MTAPATPSEAGNEHTSGDCRVDCDHPDHAFEHDIDLGWFLHPRPVGCAVRCEDLIVRQPEPGAVQL